MKTLVIDSNYLAHRALHSMGDLEFGEIKTGIIFGFLNQISQLGKHFKTNQFIFCWDSPHENSKRKQMSSVYKNKSAKNHFSESELKEFNRRKKEAFAQFTALRTQILPKLGFSNNFIQQGYEGDDLIAKTVMHRFKEYELIIVTADEDMYQLLDYAPIYKPQPKILMTAKDFVEKWGIAPSKWSTIKAIAGCTSDNVIGMSGVGEITAVKFIKKQLSAKTKTHKRLVAEHRDYIETNLPLVKLPLPGTKLMKIQRDKFDVSMFYRICTYYGLNSLLNRSGWWTAFFEGDIE